MMTDTQLIAIWQEFSKKVHETATVKGAAQELRVMAEVHQELISRGYEPQSGSWSKSNTRQVM